MIDHVTLQVNEVAASEAFDEAASALLQVAPGHSDGGAIGFFGPTPGSIWIYPAQRTQDRALHLVG